MIIFNIPGFIFIFIHLNYCYLLEDLLIKVLIKPISLNKYLFYINFPYI